MSISTYFSKIPFLSKLYENKLAKDIFFGIGLAYTTWKAYRFFSKLFIPILYTEGNISQKYGPNTWAVVTGASDGIGKEYCFQLALRHFNIVLIGRNEQKLNDVAEELKKKHPQTQTRIVVADFVNASEVEFFTKIMDQINELEISILVNNVGIMFTGKYHENDPQDLRDQLIVNCMPQMMLSRFIIPKMLSRKSRSAIITVSSFAAIFERPYEAAYAATKVFNDWLSRGIGGEYDNIDIISVKPGLVSTKLVGNRPTDIQTCSTTNFVETSLQYLGKTLHTSGHWKHRLACFKYGTLPRFIRMPLLNKRSMGLPRKEE